MKISLFVFIFFGLCSFLNGDDSKLTYRIDNYNSEYGIVLKLPHEGPLLEVSAHERRSFDVDFSVLGSCGLHFELIAKGSNIQFIPEKLNSVVKFKKVC